MPTKARDAFRTISEVADWLDVPAHVLRFWESKFSQIKPVKRAGGRRYYRPEDMELIGGIKRLLHDDGMTIRGVQKMLKEDGVKSVSALSPSLESVDDAASPRTIHRKAAAPETDDVEDATVVDDTPAVPTEEDETVAEWQADQTADTAAPAPQERPPLDIAPPPATEETVTEETVAEEAAEDAPADEPPEVAAADDTPEDAPEEEEAPFIAVEEEPDQIGGDNVVPLSGHSEPQVDPTPEPAPEPIPEPIPEPEVEATPEPAPIAARETTLPPAAPTPPAVQLDPQREKTLPPTATPPPAPEPAQDTSEEGFKLTEAQARALALKRLLRGADRSKLSADAPAIAPQLDKLRALRDKIAASLTP